MGKGYPPAVIDESFFLTVAGIAMMWLVVCGVALLL
jgi:hypothetical protein